jgi:hypothetical protein
MGESVVDGVEIRKVEPTMQRGHALMGEVLEERVLQEIDMEMNDVEPDGLPADVVEHHKVAGDVIADAREPQPLRDAWIKLG